jgi:hypothetical protein
MVLIFPKYFFFERFSTFPIILGKTDTSVAYSCLFELGLLLSDLCFYNGCLNLKSVKAKYASLFINEALLIFMNFGDGLAFYHF